MKKTPAMQRMHTTQWTKKLTKNSQYLEDGKGPAACHGALDKWAGVRCVSSRPALTTLLSIARPYVAARRCTGS